MARRMPKAVRDFWLPRFRNFKVKFVFSANSSEGREVRAFAHSVVMKKKKKKKRAQRVEGRLSEVGAISVCVSVCLLLFVMVFTKFFFTYSIIGMHSRCRRAEVDEDGVSVGEISLEEDEEAKRARRKALDSKQRGSELKPSEILAQAAALEGNDDDLSSSSDDSSDDEDDEDDDEKGDKGDDQPIFEKKTEKVVFADGEYEDSVSDHLLRTLLSCQW